MDEEFKGKMKEQIAKLEKEIYNKVAEWKRFRTTIDKLRKERTTMKQMLLGKFKSGKKPEEQEAGPDEGVR